MTDTARLEVKRENTYGESATLKNKRIFNHIGNLLVIISATALFLIFIRVGMVVSNTSVDPVFVGLLSCLVYLAVIRLYIHIYDKHRNRILFVHHIRHMTKVAKAAYDNRKS